MIKINSSQTSYSGVQTTTRGFSLVELMVVVVILGTLAAISAPSIIRGIERNNARNEARAIAGVFQRARSLASSSGKPVYAQIDQNTITLFGPVSNTVTSCSVAPGTTGNILVYSIGSRYAGAQSDNNTNNVVPCFSPSGRLLQAGTNRPFTAPPTDECDGRNLMVWLHRPDTVATSAHTECYTDSDAIGTQKDQRELINFFMIHVPYTGNAEVLQ